MSITTPLNISTAFLEKEHSIIVESNVDETTKIIEKNKVDEKDISPVFIDKYIKKMNKLSDGLIVDYNYEIINKDTIHFIALVKHIFRKFGETQKYIKATITIHEDCIEITRNDKIKLSLSSKISSEVEPFFVPYIKITNAVENTVNKTHIVFKTDEDISTYKNIDMFMIFIKNVINKIYTDLY